MESFRPSHNKAENPFQPLRGREQKFSAEREAAENLSPIARVAMKQGFKSGGSRYKDIFEKMESGAFYSLYHGENDKIPQGYAEPAIPGTKKGRVHTLLLKEGGGRDLKSLDDRRYVSGLHELEAQVLVKGLEVAVAKAQAEGGADKVSDILHARGFSEGNVTRALQEQFSDLKPGELSYGFYSDRRLRLDKTLVGRVPVLAYRTPKGTLLTKPMFGQERKDGWPQQEVYDYIAGLRKKAAEQLN